MRVALMCDYSLEYLGGAQTAFLQQARVLADAGHEVTVIAPRPRGPVPALEDHPRIDMEPVDFSLTLPAVGLPLIRTSAGLQRRLASVLRRRGVEVLHCHSEFGLVRAGFRAARRSGIPVVLTVHTFFWQALMPLQPVAAALLRGFYRWLTNGGITRASLGERPVDAALRNMTLTTARLADAVVSPSAHQARHLRAAGLVDVVVVPNTFRIDAEPVPLPGRGPTDPLRLAWIGRCVAEKRLLPFLEAVSRASRRLGPGRLQVSVIGDGLQLAEAKAAARGLEGVEFLGRVDNATVRGLVSRAHLTCLSSFGFDNQPMTVVESVLLGRGVFYVDPELREGLATCGYMAPAPDIDSMADALVELAEDPAIAEKLSRAAGGAAELFLPASFEASSRRLYERLLAHGGPAD
ncbi:glycosyltransferase family 4 protein [Zafaria sp. Z1313]|uniref:glycosyltransferase family 4 protein n=1 Tax=unclassified Zafaria TaxID=2828765 RepID=UPI002E7A7BD5|nr:glycosyltransferase family 4 protein [Zafaria sp. J156]MEE1621226.1 glycosyltransferase family 4 protein [Zafaria sp. J156]